MSTTHITTMNNYDDIEEQAIAKGGVACPFPWRIHRVLKAAAEEGFEDIVSWCPHGRAFTVHKPKEFAATVLQRYVMIVVVIVCDFCNCFLFL